MPPTWLQIRVDLLTRERLGIPDPGRILLVGPKHTFEELAASISLSFARWDLARLHESRLDDGRRIGFADPAYGRDCEDHAAVRVMREVGPGDDFEFAFDFGRDWRHRCQVLPGLADPRALYCGNNPLPPMPVVIHGWGVVPDQFERTAFDPADLAEPDEDGEWWAAAD